MQDDSDLPTVTTNTITNITQTTATGGGNVTNAGGSTVTARGVCWSTSHNPTVSGNHTTNGTGTGTYTSNITGLTANTTYYVRAFATLQVQLQLIPLVFRPAQPMAGQWVVVAHTNRDNLARCQLRPIRVTHS